MERYNITVKENPFDGCPYADMVVSDDGAYMRYDDAKRALDAEREKAKQLDRTLADVYQQRDGLQAQLRQVEGERDRLTQQLHTLYAKHPEDSCYGAMPKLRAEVANLRQLVEALPVAGLPVEHARSDDFVVLQANGEWMVHTYNYWAKFATEDEARAYIALLEYRASLPAQPAQGGA